MSKKGFGVRLLGWVTDHPWLKLISLVLAIVVWLYAKGEIAKYMY
jgi:hypothetical protein